MDTLSIDYLHRLSMETLSLSTYIYIYTSGDLSLDSDRNVYQQ